MLQKRPKIIRNKHFILQMYENNLIKSTFVPQNIKTYADFRVIYIV